MSERTIHHGRNIKRIREIYGIKQEALALELGDDWNQKKISLLESKEVVDDDLLNQVAKALKVSPEAIKNFAEENIAFQIQNMNDNSQAIYNYNFNPLDKYIEAIEENKKLYERLLQSEREKIELLERMRNVKK
jgi:transcriptional regulator with XRE-family HTH domain